MAKKSFDARAFDLNGAADRNIAEREERERTAASKKEPFVRLNLNISQDMHERLRERAFYDHTTISHLVRESIEEYLSR